MKKRVFRTLLAVFLAAVLMSLSIVPVLAIGIEFTASLSIGRRIYYVGDEVEFTVNVENTDNQGLDGISIYNTRGSTPIASHGHLDAGESVNIPVSKVFNTAGEFGVKFKVVGMRSGETETVTTNTVTATINNPTTPSPEPTPAPTPELTPTPSAEPSPKQTLAAAPTPEPTLIAIADEDIEDGQPQTPTAQNVEQSAETEQGEKNNTALYIILGVVGALLLAAAVIIIMKRKKVIKD